MERELKIKTKDRHIIYGTLRMPKKLSDALLIFVHGLTGHQNEHILYNGARYFEKKGINTFRFDLYTGEKGGRTLTDCGISTHSADLNIVVKYFRKKYRKIFVAGHSLGGLTVLLADIDVIDGIILWDSSCRLVRRKKDDIKYNKYLDAYVDSWGTEYLVGKKLNSEWENFPAPGIAIQKVNKPVKVIIAGKGELIKAGKEYFKYAKQPKEFAIIKGAGHNFNEEGTVEELFRETYEFVRKYIR